jgi:predicted transposase YbfD/YdcC
MGYIKKKFSEITDKRHPSYVEHPLSDVLIIVMCSVMCGLDGLCDIVVLAEKRAKFFKRKFGIEAIPSKPAFSRILNMIDGDEAGKVIIEIMRERTKFTAHLMNILAVDGKAIRSTPEKGKPKSALQILTAYMTGSGVVSGQASIHEKTNEIPVFQEMLNYLDIKGKIITADAMHCQRETCARIIKGKGDYVFGLKGNQKIFAVRRITESKHKTTDETCYYITSCYTSAEELLKITREHWKIESMHWLLDVVFSEDDCAILSENGHKTLNILRKLALMAHRAFIASLHKKCSINANLLKCLMDEDYLDTVLQSL